MFQKARSGDLEQRRRPGTIASEWRHPLTISKHYATIISNLAVRIRLGLSRRFSELAVFDARLYIRVRRIDEPA